MTMFRSADDKRLDPVTAIKPRLSKAVWGKLFKIPPITVDKPSIPPQAAGQAVASDGHAYDRTDSDTVAVTVS